MTECGMKSELMNGECIAGNEPIKTKRILQRHEYLSRKRQL